MTFITLAFISVTFFKADLLLPLNKLWMRFGHLIGLIVSPIVLALMYFGIFTPIAIITKLFGRDELKLKFMSKQTHWISRESANLIQDNFKQQF